MKLNNNFCSCSWLLAQLKPEELAAVDGVDLVLGATENLKSLIILTICLKMIGRSTLVRSLMQIFYVGSYSIGDRTRAFLKVQDGLRL
jgi:threonylcarbamoyladenosine tRNA methylthiotransferase MtaB